MLKHYFFSAMIFASLSAFGQVTISVQLPPSGLLQKDQLWNVVLVNNGDVIQEASISLELQDAMTGQNILSANSRSFMLSHGLKALTVRDVQPIQYSFMGGAVASTYIPLGNYVACYRLAKATGKGIEPVADDCVNIQVSPLSPPILSSPADKELIQGAYPIFTWLPPTPSEMFNELSYDLLIVEVLSGQQPAEAVMNNIPVYFDGNIRLPFLAYPSSFHGLRPGKTYAWQVTARNGLSYAAQTEVWSFSLPGSDSAAGVLSGIEYALLRLKAESSAVTYLNGNGLFFKYYSYDKEHTTMIRISTTDGRLIQQVRHNIVYGNNFIKVSLGPEFRPGEVFILELEDLHHIVYHLKFSIL